MRFNLILFLVASAGVIQLAYAQDSCPYAYGPDGSFYDLSSIANKIFTLTDVYNGQTFYNNISICSASDLSCSYSCPTLYSAGVCEFWDPNTPYERVCFGNANTRRVTGLAGGAGVQITYGGGDYCSGCNPAQPRASLITLKCDPNVPKGHVKWAPMSGWLSPVHHFNGTMNCGNKNGPVPSPSSTPSSAPSIFNPNKHVTVQYYGRDPSCNGSDAFMVTVKPTRDCQPGCQQIGSKYIKTECNDNIIHLPPGATWVEQITYDNSCDTPQSAVYTRSHTCTGNRVWAYQECDADFVWTYDCGSTYCRQCTMVEKSATEICSNGSKYKCVASATKNKHRNPLL